MDSWWSRWRDAAFREVDGASTALFRILFGVIMVWEVFRYLSKGWVAKYYIDPEYNFKYIFFEWVEPWPGVGMYIHFLVLGLLGVAITVGWQTKWALRLFFIGIGYVFLLEQAHYLNHIYLVVMVAGMLSFLPLDNMLSVKAWRDPSARSDTVPAWTVWMLRLPMGVVYFYGGLAKLNADWLRGQPMIDWMGNRADMPVVGPLISSVEGAVAMAYAGMLFDLAVTPLLLWKRTRAIALVATFSFHLSNHFLFSIGIFPWLAMAATLTYLEPDWPRRVFPGVYSWWSERSPGHTDQARPARGLVLGLMGIFVGYNLLFPLRHVLYPGNPSWTEEGHRYAWHMKLRSKSGRATFVIEDPDTGERWTDNPEKRLTSRQNRKMRSRPDMVLQYAHWLAEEARAEGRPNVEVYAKVRASLNTRRRQDLIDPSVDLAKVERDLWPADWIVPLEEPLPGWDW